MTATIISRLDFAAALLTDGDNTYSVDTFAPVALTTGYVVGQAGGVASFVADADTTVEAVGLWLADLPDSVELVGSWSDNGTVYIDAVEVFADINEALIAGRERGELAIYDALAGIAVEVAAI